MGYCFLYKRGGGGSGGSNRPVIVKTVLGSVISLNDSTNGKIRGLRIFGKTTQNGTPTPEAPVPLESVGDDGDIGVKATGKNIWGNGDYSFSGSKRIVLENPLLPGVYTMSAFCTSSDTDDTRCGVNFQNGGSTGDGNVYTYLLRDVRSSRTVVLENKVTEIYLYSSSTNSFSSGDTATFSEIQIELGSAATEYEPYKETQSATFDTPNGLPGIQVTSGGNYTDGNGQIWLCDEIDGARGVRVWRAFVGVLNGTEKWNVGSAKDGKKRFSCAEFSTQLKLVADANSKANLLCSNFPTVSANDTYNGIMGISVSNNSRLYVFYEGVEQTADGIKAYFTANPTTFIAELITPIETPLSAEELAQYAALHTNCPNTTIFNDEGADMEVKYTSGG